MAPEKASPERPPILKTSREWNEYVGEKVGSERLDRINAARTAAERREALFVAFREAKPEWNGRAEKFAHVMAVNKEQLDAYERFDKALHGGSIDASIPEEVNAAVEAEDGNEEPMKVAEKTMEGKEKKGNALMRAATSVYRETLGKRPVLTIAAAAAIAAFAWFYLAPAGFAIPAAIERLMAQVPQGKMRLWIESLLKLSPTTGTLQPGVGLSPPNSMGVF